MNSDFQTAMDISVIKSRNKNYNIKQVANILNIPYTDNRNTCQDIYDYLLKESKNSNSLEYFLEKFNPSDKDFCNTLINTLYELFHPSDMKLHSPIKISKKQYKSLVDKRKAGKRMSKEENKLLDEALYIKFCHCIKKLYIKNVIDYQFFNKELKYNPYAICTSSIYKNRDFDVPPSAAINCSKTFDWYRNINYGKLKY